MIKILVVFLSFFLFTSVVHSDEIETLIKLKELEEKVKELEADEKTDQQIEENIKSMNEYIKRGLKTINNGQKPSVKFNIGGGKYLIMTFDENSHLPTSYIKTETPMSDKGVELKASDGNDVAGGSLPKIIFALSSVIYVIFSAYFLFLTGYNIRYGNFLYSLLDLGIWIVASAIMYQLLRSLQ